MKTWMLPAFAVLLFAHVSGAAERFLPPNSLRIPVDSRAAGGVTEAQFNAVLDKIFPIYKDEIRVRGGVFVIDRQWKNAEVNAYADRSGDNWYIHMYGGLARHPSLTPDGFALVACHELGHHLGGAPKFAYMNEWAANEGEADYFATLKCMRRYFAHDDNEKILAAMQVDASVAATCATEHRGQVDRLICMRTAMAGFSLSSLFQDLSKDAPIAFTTPDTHVVLKTDDDHPGSQCRLDTYLRGSLCTVPVTQNLSDTDYRPGSCFDAVSQAPGLRPRCWFSP